MNTLNPSALAEYYRNVIRLDINKNNYEINIVGILATDKKASETYAEYTAAGCKSVGINFTLKRISPKDIYTAIEEENNNPDVHGIFVYYPIFSDANDFQIKDLIDPRKDVEGLSKYWTDKLYNNERFDDVDNNFKALVPCTPLAIVKILETAGAHIESPLPLESKKITVFNRSDVVGKPLACMLSNDGAIVFSFDEYGGFEFKNGMMTKNVITRQDALATSDIVITGVPSPSFDKVKSSELKKGVISLNFSTIPNFEDDAKIFSDIYVPRVGPLTVAMCLRNALRLYSNYHLGKKNDKK